MILLGTYLFVTLNSIQNIMYHYSLSLIRIKFHVRMLLVINTIFKIFFPE